MAAIQFWIIWQPLNIRQYAYFCVTTKDHPHCTHPLRKLLIMHSVQNNFYLQCRHFDPNCLILSGTRYVGMTSFAPAKGIEVEQVKKDSGTRMEGPFPPASRTVGSLRSMQNQMQVSSKDWTSKLLAWFPGWSHLQSAVCQHREGRPGRFGHVQWHQIDRG